MISYASKTVQLLLTLTLLIHLIGFSKNADAAFEYIDANIVYIVEQIPYNGVIVGKYASMDEAAPVHIKTLNDYYGKVIYTLVSVHDIIYFDFNGKFWDGTYFYPNQFLNSEVTCPQGYFKVQGANRCARPVPESEQLLSLIPIPQTPTDPRPKGTEGKDPKSSTLELIAKVMEGGTPKAVVAVTFAVEPIANSGGHDHHDASRPKGEVKANSLTTDANGEIKVTFEASEFAGTHVVAAACSSCTNTSVTKNIDVKVPDLIPMQADSSVPPRYELAGNTSPVGVKHKGNHYFTASAKAYLLNLIDHYNSFAWQPVAVNDASIIWGGWFDIYSNWAGSHAEHRIGEEVDLGFLVGTNASKIKRGYDEVCKDKKVEIPSTILWHDIPKPAGKYDPHFHVRLSGSYTKGPSAGKYAPCKSDSGTK